MKTNKKFITSALVFGFIASTFSSQASAAVSGDELVKELSQGFSSLKQEFIVEDFKKYGVSVKEMKDYIDAANHQTPLALGVSKNELYDNSEVLYVTPKYVSGEGKALTNKQAKVEKEVKRVVKSLIKKNMTEKQKHQAIYDYVVKKVKYDQATFNKYKTTNNKTFTNAHTAYGALVNYLAVCQGISSAYKALADEAGLESIVVTGTYKGEGHQWNKIKVNGKWSNLDATIKNSLVFATDEKATALNYKEDLRYALDSEISAGKYSTSGKPVKVETVTKTETAKTSAVKSKNVTASNATTLFGNRIYELGYPVFSYDCVTNVAAMYLELEPNQTDYRYHLIGTTDKEALAKEAVEDFERVLSKVRGSDYLKTHQVNYSVVGESLNIEIAKK